MEPSCLRIASVAITVVTSDGFPVWLDGPAGGKDQHDEFERGIFACGRVVGSHDEDDAMISADIEVDKAAES